MAHVKTARNRAQAHIFLPPQGAHCVKSRWCLQNSMLLEMPATKAIDALPMAAALQAPLALVVAVPGRQHPAQHLLVTRCTHSEHFRTTGT